MTITLPSVTNPGVAFTHNSYEIMKAICECFACNGQQRIPYKKFQQKFMEQDSKGDSKIRMLFPLLRKAGCIYPDEEGNVVFRGGSFFTQVGTAFHKISGLYWEAISRAKEIAATDKGQAAIVLRKARTIYFEIAKVLYSNLCENDKGYKYLLWFIAKYGPVTKDEIWVLFYVLEQSSSVAGSIEECACDERKLNELMELSRSNRLKVRSDKANNAVSYYSSVLKTLLMVEVQNGKCIITEEAKSIKS